MMTNATISVGQITAALSSSSPIATPTCPVRNRRSEPYFAVSGAISAPCTPDINAPIPRKTAAVDASVRLNRAPPNKENVASKPENANIEKNPTAASAPYLRLRNGTADLRVSLDRTRSRVSGRRIIAATALTNARQPAR